MGKLVALLRGINVGGHRVSMPALAKVFESVGLGRVETLLASGNVIFDWDAGGELGGLELRIEAALLETLGYEVAVFLRTPVELAGVIEDCPFAVLEGESLYVTFFKKRLGALQRKNVGLLAGEMDSFGHGKREMYRHVRGKVSESAVLEGHLNRALKGVVGTARKVNTVRRLVEKYG